MKEHIKCTLSLIIHFNVVCCIGKPEFRFLGLEIPKKKVKKFWTVDFLFKAKSVRGSVWHYFANANTRPKNGESAVLLHKKYIVLTQSFANNNKRERVNVCGCCVGWLGNTHTLSRVRGKQMRQKKVDTLIKKTCFLCVTHESVHESHRNHESNMELKDYNVFNWHFIFELTCCCWKRRRATQCVSQRLKKIIAPSPIKLTENSVRPVS